MNKLSLNDFSGLVGAIYDCALKPEGWTDVCQRIGGLLDCTGAGIVVEDYENRRVVMQYGYGADRTYFDLQEKYSADNPMLPAIMLADMGTVVTNSMVIDRVEFEQGRFYREVVKPSRMWDAMGFLIMRHGTRSAYYGSVRAEGKSLFDESDVQLLTQFAPHICRAIAISDQLELQTLSSDALSQTLDAIASGVFLLGDGGDVVHTNLAALQILETGNVLRLKAHKLTPVDPVAAEALLRGLESMAQGTAVPSPEPIILHSRTETPGLIGTLLPLDQGVRRRVMAPFAAAAALFVQDPTVAPQFPGEAFARLYGLTGAELRVLLALAPGLGTKQAAELLGNSEATIKTHLHRIFAKTGTSRQAEVIALLHASSVPLVGSGKP